MDLSAKTLIIIAGPTAVGKSSLAMGVAQQLGCPIISADSRQIYREMTIGTAKPSIEDLKAVTHHFINELSVTENYSAGRYEREVLARLKLIYQEHDYAVMCGGTGLYLRAVREGLDAFPDINDEIIHTVQEEYECNGLKHLQQELIQYDPAYAERVDMQNARRLIRAIAVVRQSGTTYSAHLQGQAAKRPWKEMPILLTMERSKLTQRINRRVDLMMHHGLVDEVRGLKTHEQKRPLLTVGYQEIFDFLNGSIDLPQAVELIKIHTRQYAKRQMTWFRKYGTWTIYHEQSVEKSTSAILQQCRL